MSPKNLKYFVHFVLLFTILVILWGAYVRASGSGAGCGSHWPLCNGQILPTSPTLKTQIEFFHRITSGLSLFFIFAVGYLTFKTFPKGTFARTTAAAACISISLEAVIGAGLVLFELVSQDQSLKRTLSIALHFSNTLALLASLVLLAASIQREGRGWYPSQAPLRNQSFFFAALFFCVGMAGSITALGDTLFPAQSLIQGIHQDLTPSSHFLVKLRVIHPILAVAFAALISPWIYSISRQTSLGLRAKGNRLLIALGTNLILGVLNLAQLAPIHLQILHLLFGVSLWVLFLLFIDELAANPQSP